MDDRMISDEELLALADRLVDQAQPGEELEVIVAQDRDTEICVYDGEVESLSSADSSSIGVRVVRDGRQGLAWAGTFDEDVAAATLRDARDNATFGSVDDHQGLAEPDGVAPVDIDVYRERALEHPTQEKVAVALELERATRGADARIAGIETAEYADVLAAAAVVTTTGIRAVSRETACWLSVVALASEGDETQTGFGFSLGREPAELDLSRAAGDASHRATRMLGAVRPPTGRLTVVLDPWVTAQLLEIVGSTLSGEAVLKGRSPFADRLGEPIAAPCISLLDDPTDPAAFTASSTDGEGLATRRNQLVEGGRLGMFVQNAYTGRRSGTASTGSAVRGDLRSAPGVGCVALRLVPGQRSQAELVGAVGDGILVQDVSGLHSGVNPVSGDFSTGAEGLRIRDGGLAEPLREFTLASTLQRLLMDVVEVGADLEWLPMSAAGTSVIISDVTVSGS